MGRAGLDNDALPWNTEVNRVPLMQPILWGSYQASDQASELPPAEKLV